MAVTAGHARASFDLKSATLPLIAVLLKTADLAELAQQAVSPSLIVIGEVVALRKQLAWFGEQAGEQAETEASRHELKLVSLA